MTKEQKTLKTFSTIELVAGIVNLVFAGVMFFSGGGEAEAIGEGIGSLISAVICLVVWNALKKVGEDGKRKTVQDRPDPGHNRPRVQCPRHRCVCCDR